MPKKSTVSSADRQLQASLGLQTSLHPTPKDVPRDHLESALTRTSSPHSHREHYIDRAHRKAREGDLKGALAVYTFAIRAHSKDWSTWSHRAALKLRMGDYRGAKIDYDEAIRLNPLGASYEGRASCRERLGDLDAALDDLNEAIRRNPSAIKYCARARVKTSLGDLRGARADYDSGLHLDASYGVDFAARAAIRLLLGDSAGAVEDCDAAIALEPRLAEAYANRAAARRKLGSMPGSKADLETAISLQPDLLSLTRQSSAGLKHHFRTVAHALSDYDRSVRLEPSHSEGHRRAARVQSKRPWSSSLGCALRLVNGAHRLDTSHAVATFNDAFVMPLAWVNGSGACGGATPSAQAIDGDIRNFNDAFAPTWSAASRLPALRFHSSLVIEGEESPHAALPPPLAPVRPLHYMHVSADGETLVLLSLPPSLQPLQRHEPPEEGACVDEGSMDCQHVLQMVNLEVPPVAFAFAKLDIEPHDQMLAHARDEVETVTECGDASGSQSLCSEEHQWSRMRGSADGMGKDLVSPTLGQHEREWLLEEDVVTLPAPLRPMCAAASASSVLDVQL